MRDATHHHGLDSNAFNPRLAHDFVAFPRRKSTWTLLGIASRLVDNRHFLSDVMFGACVGMASGWTVDGRHGRDSYALQPVPIRGGAMVVIGPVSRTRAAALPKPYESSPLN